MAYVSRSSEQASIFPPNNLPSDSQVWGQNIEKRLFNIENNFKAAEINNVTRDSQLISSYTRLDIAVTKINQILTDLGVLNDSVFGAGGLDEAIANVTDVVLDPIDNTKINGLNLKAGTVLADNVVSSYVYAGAIGANQITAGYIQGLTFATAFSGTRVVTTGSELQFYGPSGLGGGIIGNYGGQNAIYAYSNGYFVLTGPYGIYLNGGAGVYGGSLFCNDGNITTINTVSGGSGDFGSLTTVVTGGAVQRTALSGGGTTGASVTDSGSFVRTSSSERYKQDIQDLALAYESILSLQPKKFRRKDEVESHGDDARFYPGFIAEEIAGTDLDIFAFYEKLEDGTSRPDGVHYPEITAALVLALKHQDQLIKSLTARIEALEA